MKVSIAVRQKFHGYHLAQHLFNQGSLNKLFTAYYGSFLGKDNSKGYSIPKKYIATHLRSAISTYLLHDNGFETDNRFGKWVAPQLGEEDIIVTWGIQGLPIIEQAKKKGIKVIVERCSSHVITQRDLLLEEYRKLGAGTRALEESFSPRRVERECLEYELADFVAIPSVFVKESFLQNNVPGDKLFLNSYGADLQQFKPIPVVHDNFRFIYTGALSIRKGIHLLLEAFQQFPVPGTELWLVGNADEDFKPILKRYPQAGVRFFPAVPQHELPLYYNQCDAFVIASIEEGLATVQLQAMACGLPLLCTTNTGGADLLTEGEEGLVVPAGNIAALREKMLQLASSPAECRNMGYKAVKKVTNGYSWKDCGERAIEKYKSLC